MMNISRKKIAGYLLFIIVFFVAGIYLSGLSFDSSEKINGRTQILMGTVVEIRTRDENEDLSNNAINAAFREIKRIDALFSTYNSKSTIWKINHSEKKKYILSDELFNFLLKCDSIRTLTGGAFDPALGSLTKAWGFYSDTPSVPAQKIIDKALLKSGWKNVRLIDKGIIEKESLRLDFGAIAKGYAADKAIEVLKSHGIKDAFVNLGGQIKVTGNSWTVGIKHPRVFNLLLAKLEVKNYSVSTSGDYEKFFFEKGERYCHIFDPKTGYPAGKCRSVTVINKDGMLADALSTACFVLGPLDAMNLINSIPDTEGLVVDSSGSRFMSNGFKKFLIK